MAQRTAETDRGANFSSVEFDRATVTATVSIRTNHGERRISLSRAEILSATTAQDRTDLLAVLDLFYAVALTKGGFSG